MIAMEKYRRKSVLLSLFVLCLSVFLLSISIPVQADDFDDSQTFNNLDPLETEHDPDKDPWKGWFSLTAMNNTDEIWGDFHFDLFDIPGYSSTGVFCDSSTAGCSDPTSDRSVLEWTISNGGKTLDLRYYADPIYVTQTGTFTVYTDNTDNHQPFGVAYYPTVVPEPISSTLFIIGGATLGFRRFWKKRKSA
jgi:hypothetical protein